ncbi:MAG: acetolactate synthase large subunit, partial [Acidobacteria bacterium]|nr:acetolactate synthase large subunit [Acidobacteriota bacterium]
CIDGDGSFQMNIQELATAVCYHIPVKVAIINNGYHGMVRQWQQIFYKSRYSESYLGSGNPDFVKVAEGYGAQGFCITDPRDVRPSLEKAIEIDGPVLLDFRVVAEENVYPMIPSGGTIEQMIG